MLAYYIQKLFCFCYLFSLSFFLILLYLIIIYQYLLLFLCLYWCLAQILKNALTINADSVCSSSQSTHFGRVLSDPPLQLLVLPITHYSWILIFLLLSRKINIRFLLISFLNLSSMISSLLPFANLLFLCLLFLYPGCIWKLCQYLFGCGLRMGRYRYQSSRDLGLSSCSTRHSSSCCRWIYTVKFNPKWISA